MPLQTIKDISFNQKRVFLRVDFNVPIKDNRILDDFRLQASMTTIQTIMGAKPRKLILATHMGKPKTSVADPTLSTQQLLPWLSDHGIQAAYAKDITAATQSNAPIVLLENLRFFAGEKPATLVFAKKLAQLADVYVNDAFGTMHRTDASVTLLAQQFDRSSRCIGLLVEKEIATLKQLKAAPKQPFVLVLGGAKLDDKIPLINNLFDAPPAQRVQTVLIGGALALPFLKAQGKSTGTTPITPAAVTAAQAVIHKAAQQNITLELPIDGLTITGQRGSAPSVYPIDALPAAGTYVDIGPATIAHFTQVIASAGTIFANGTMGISEWEPYAAGTRAIFEAIANTQAHTVIGGGDAASAVHGYHLTEQIDFVSTGGGATLAYLGTKEPFNELPGLAAINC